MVYEMDCEKIIDVESKRCSCWMENTGDGEAQADYQDQTVDRHGGSMRPPRCRPMSECCAETKKGRSGEPERQGSGRNAVSYPVHTGGAVTCVTPWGTGLNWIRCVPPISPGAGVHAG